MSQRTGRFSWTVYAIYLLVIVVPLSLYIWRHDHSILSQVLLLIGVIAGRIVNHYIRKRGSHDTITTKEA
jgi:hypothetical protein